MYSCSGIVHVVVHKNVLSARNGIYYIWIYIVLKTTSRVTVPVVFESLLIVLASHMYMEDKICG